MPQEDVVATPVEQVVPPADPYAAKRAYYIASSEVVVEGGRKIQVVTDYNGKVTRTDIGPADQSDGEEDEETTEETFARLMEQQRQTDAFSRLRALLNRVGLSALENNVRDLIARGITDSDAILFELRDTPTFQTRFKANTARAKKGLPELDPATYVGLEQSYRDVLASNNLPSDFYDDQDDFNAWIEGEVSPSEVQARITEGYDKVKNADPAVKAQMQRLYGVTESELAAYFIDPKRAKPLFDSAVARRQAQAAQIAARGVEMAGLELSAESAEDLVRRGYTPEEAQRVFAERAGLAGLYQEMGSEIAAGEALSEAEKLGAAFGYDVAAQQALERRRRQRVGEFQAGGQFARTSGATSGTVETGVGTAQ